MMKGRSGDQQPSARKPDGPRDGDDRDGKAKPSARRPDGPPHAERRGKTEKAIVTLIATRDLVPIPRANLAIRARAMTRNVTAPHVMTQSMTDRRVRVQCTGAPRPRLTALHAVTRNAMTRPVMANARRAHVPNLFQAPAVLPSWIAHVSWRFPIERGKNSFRPCARVATR